MGPPASGGGGASGGGAGGAEASGAEGLHPLRTAQAHALAKAAIQ
jgi:hypothetical protein